MTLSLPLVSVRSSHTVFLASVWKTSSHHYCIALTARVHSRHWIHRLTTRFSLRLDASFFRDNPSYPSHCIDSTWAKLDVSAIIAAISIDYLDLGLVLSFWTITHKTAGPGSFFLVGTLTGRTIRNYARLQDTTMPMFDRRPNLSTLVVPAPGSMLGDGGIRTPIPHTPMLGSPVVVSWILSTSAFGHQDSRGCWTTS